MRSRYNDATVMGRVFLAAIFGMSGVNKVLHFEQTVGYMQSNGITIAPDALLLVAAGIEILGALMLVVGWYTRIAAAGLLLFLIPTTLVFHDFWSHSGMEMQSQLIHFMKNLAIMGGLAYAGTFGAPSFSIDARRGTSALEPSPPPSRPQPRGPGRPVHGT